MAENNTTFRLKDVKELTYAAFGKITKVVWTKAEEHEVKIKKEYCKENFIDRSQCRQRAPIENVWSTSGIFKSGIFKADTDNYRKYL